MHGYDVRAGAAAYAPIIGGMGGVIVTAVVLVFTVRPPGQRVDPTLLGFATGLLVLGLIASLLAAAVFAAIGSERVLTVNLPAAALHAGTATAVGFVATIAAFEVLSAIYLPTAKSLFAMITVGAELGAGVLVALVLGDAWLAVADTPWNTRPQWIADRRAGSRNATIACAIMVAFLAVGAVLYFAGVKLSLGVRGSHAFVAAGIALAVASALAGVMRTWHDDGGQDHGVKLPEAVVSLGLLTAYLVLMMLLLP